MATSVANNGGMLRRFIKAIEPWYDWGTTTVFRLNTPEPLDAEEGPARYFELQWLGLHLSITIGRTPKREVR